MFLHYDTSWSYWPSKQEVPAGPRKPNSTAVFIETNDCFILFVRITILSPLPFFPHIFWLILIFFHDVFSLLIKLCPLAPTSNIWLTYSLRPAFKWKGMDFQQVHSLLAIVVTMEMLTQTTYCLLTASGSNMAKSVSRNNEDWIDFISLKPEVNPFLWVTSHWLCPVLFYSQWKHSYKKQMVN